MPDLITHFAAAYILKIPDQWSRFRVPFYLGAILPDLLTRPFVILFPQTNYIIYSLHTPIVTAIVCLLASQFFSDEIRKGVRANLLLGITLHYGLDFLQKHVITSYYWFFPFSWRTLELGLFWPEDTLRLVPLWIGMMAIMEITLVLRRQIKDSKAFKR